jgi:hypothetical protein
MNCLLVSWHYELLIFLVLKRSLNYELLSRFLDELIGHTLTFSLKSFNFKYSLVMGSCMSLVLTSGATAGALLLALLCPDTAGFHSVHFRATPTAPSCSAVALHRRTVPSHFTDARRRRTSPTHSAIVRRVRTAPSPSYSVHCCRTSYIVW